MNSPIVCLIQRSTDSRVVSAISKRTGLRVLLCVAEALSLTQPTVGQGGVRVVPDQVMVATR